MQHRGRKSAAELSVVQAPSAFGRPPAPDDLTAAQKDLWLRIVASKIPGWFDAPTLPLLRAYCVNVTELERIQKALIAVDLTEEDSGIQYNNISRVADRLALRAQTLATSMRLTQQSRYSARKNGDEEAGDKPRPWEFGATERTRQR